MISEGIRANLLRVKAFEEPNFTGIETLLNEWLTQYEGLIVHDISFQRGEQGNRASAIVVFRLPRQ